MNEDRPSRAEAEADARDDRTPVEEALHLGAFVTRCGAEDQHFAVDYGVYPFSGFLVPSKQVGDAVVTILNETTPGDLDLIISVLVRAYGLKAVALEKLPPDEDEEQDEWDDEDPAI